MEATLLKQVDDIKEQIRGFHEWQDNLDQGAERAEKEREQISNCVRDLLDQGDDLRIEIWKMVGDFDQLKEDKNRLEASGLSLADLRVASSVLGCVQGCFSWVKCTQKEEKEQAEKTPWSALARAHL